MDRSEELQKIIEIYVTHDEKVHQDKSDKDQINLGSSASSTKESLSAKQPPSLSNLLLLALQSYEGIYQNEDFVKQIERYSAMKEFSNDSSKAISQLSHRFEKMIQQIQMKNQKLKIFIDQSNQSSNQILQHYRLIHKYLVQAINNQVSSFKKALKEHQKHVEERTKRIEKYGNASISSLGASNPIIQSASTANYAMFQTPNTFIPPPPILPNSSGSNNPDQKSSLTHRRNPRSVPVVSAPAFPNASSSSSASSSYPNYMNNNPQQQSFMRKDDHRLRQAEKAEATLQQMGHLFTQMATLISEQSEVILRIEDDVEAGYSNTMEGYKSLEHVYTLTKGNRAMILKIFAILIFFIFLFLVWT